MKRTNQRAAKLPRVLTSDELARTSGAGDQAGSSVVTAPKQTQQKVEWVYTTGNKTGMDDWL